jgi:hypothetical protein
LPIQLSTTQSWLREYSVGLESSFRVSAQIAHTTTKADDRENQILSFLKGVLPSRVVLEPKIVIVDSANSQCRSFDVSLVDHFQFPRLLGDPIAVMVESVVCAIEIKSALDDADLTDIFEKSTSLRSLSFESTPGLIRAVAAGFSYSCANMNLRFFDFSWKTGEFGTNSPSGICVLNKGYFGLANVGGLSPEDVPTNNSIPIYYRVAEDALLVFVYFLAKWVTTGSSAAATYYKYSEPFFKQIKPFKFDNDFLAQIRNDPSARAIARKEFEGKAGLDVEACYANARKSLGI